MYIKVGNRKMGLLVEIAQGQNCRNVFVFVAGKRLFINEIFIWRMSTKLGIYWKLENEGI